MSKLFSNDYLTICRNVRARWDANEERHQEKDVYCEGSLTSISHKILLW